MKPMTPATICVFARPPVPGRTKARLAAEIGPEAAAAIAGALLADTLAAIRAVPGVQVVLSVTEPFFDGRGPQRAYGARPASARADEATAYIPQWVQPEGGLGERLEWTLHRALEQSACALAVGADTPALTPAMVRQALLRLEDCDAVLGPADDGGFYLLGVKACPTGLLHGIRWSDPATRDDTLARLQAAKLSCGFGVPWFDLDTAADLRRAAALLEADTAPAPHLAAELRRLGLGVTLS